MILRHGDSDALSQRRVAGDSQYGGDIRIHGDSDDVTGDVITDGDSAES